MSKKVNVLWVFSDQQPAYTLSCNGDENSRTPNIDILAGRGANFKNAVSGFPLCCPFRGSLMTGVYPHDCVPGHAYPLPTELPTVADHFNQAGYDTAYFGKWHLGGFKLKDVPRLGTTIVPPEARGRFKRWIGYENNNAQYDCYVHGHLEPDTEYPLTKLSGYETDSLTDYLLEYLQAPERQDRPFFAVLSVQPPHNPYIAPASYAKKYSANDIKLRPNVAHNPHTQKVAKESLAQAYAMIENLDDNVGRIWECLRQLDKDSETVIFYFSDHGDMHGSHGQFKKTCPWQEAINVPFVVFDGRKYTQYSTVEESEENYLINHVDILPTTLGIANLDIPKELLGFDYSPVIRKEKLENYPQSAYLQNIIPTGHGNSIDRAYRGVITMDNWKYVCTEQSDWLLYDLNNDPLEECNLAFNRKYYAKRKELRQITAEWIAKTNDNFTVPATI